MVRAFMSLSLLVLTACSHQTTPKTVVEYQPIKIPSTLLKECKATAPLELQADRAQREAALMQYTISLLKDLSLCNQQIVQIRAMQR